MVFGIALESFEFWTKFIAILSAFIPNLEHAFINQLSWIDLNTLFRELENVLICLWSLKKTTFLI